MSEIPYTNDLDTLRTWVGGSIERTDVVSASSCEKLSHTLGRDLGLEVGDVLPALWHFINHVDSVPADSVGRDGHPKRGGFLPPVALPRRMWAGGRLTFHADLFVGDTVTKRSTVETVDMKEGRSGLLCFVTVRHELIVGDELRITEEQDLVYRDDPAPDAPKPAPKPAPDTADFSAVVTPSEVMLFRYSALTFNGHRIHYDREYARDVEGYPSLVFHGPLTATLLAELAVSQTGEALSTFTFRGVAPLFDDQPFTISGTRNGNDVRLWAAGPSGVAMQATATLLVA